MASPPRPPHRPGAGTPREGGPGAALPPPRLFPPAPESDPFSFEGLPLTPRAARTRRSTAQKIVGALLDGRYRVSGILGEGGMGVVFAAEDVDSGKEVALKVLHPSASNDENLRRFRRETRAAYALRHPHICQVFGYGTVGDGSPYIVMELLRGETLRARLQDEGALTIGDSIAIGMQLLDGLAAAHQRGVLHRDVKPSNVFLTTSRKAAPVVKLIDFGLAKLLPSWTHTSQPEDASVITKTGVTPGTPHYLSPEQLTGARDLDERADVWAMGLIFYEMLSGQRAFDGPNYQVLAASIALNEPPNLRSLCPDIPDQLELVIRRALVKERRQRYANAMVFKQALLECWARIRAAGIARGELFQSGRLEGTAARPRKGLHEGDTEIMVPVFAETGASNPTMRLNRVNRPKR